MGGYKGFLNLYSFKVWFQTMLGYYSPTVLEGIDSVAKKDILSFSEQAMRHEFDLLGSGPVSLNPIDWHVDFKSGKRWGKKFYRDMGRITGSDIKVPWELSRCHHFLWLGEAYLITGDEKYAQEIIDEINWWIEDNPLMYSVNWTCSMDVAFRAVNWMSALNMISEYQGFDEEFSTKVAKSLWQHGFFIRNNLERQIPYSNNHYASDIVGLLYIGALFKHTSKGRRWFKFALKEYYKEVLTQVLPSGVHYERSVSYHRLMTEMLSYPVYMLQRVGIELPEDVYNRIHSMYAYVANYTKPNGLAPLIADNDDGRFLPFMRRDFRVHSYLNDAASIENRMVSAGLKPKFCVPTKTTRFYIDAGFAIVRDKNDYLFVNNGGYSKRPTDNQNVIGTHTHNDFLSFELALDGKDLIIDAGTYLYTSSMTDRNAFRSTAKHNTVLVDEEEQNGFAAPFALKRNVRVGKIVQNDDHSFEGDYKTVGGKMHHHRKFALGSGECVIIDRLEKKGAGHSANFYFHFAEGMIPVICNSRLLLDNKYVIEFSVKPNQINIIDDTLSPSFGVLVSAKTAVINYVFNERLQATTKIGKING